MGLVDTLRESNLLLTLDLRESNLFLTLDLRESNMLLDSGASSGNCASDSAYDLQKGRSPPSASRKSIQRKQKTETTSSLESLDK